MLQLLHHRSRMTLSTWFQVCSIINGFIHILRKKNGHKSLVRPAEAAEDGGSLMGLENPKGAEFAKAFPNFGKKVWEYEYELCIVECVSPK